MQWAVCKGRTPWCNDDGGGDCEFSMVLPFGGTSLMFTMQLVRMRMEVIPRASSGSSTKPALHLETWSCVRGGHLQIFWTLTLIHCIQGPTCSQCLLTLIYFCGSEKVFEHFYFPPFGKLCFSRVAWIHFPHCVLRVSPQNQLGFPTSPILYLHLKQN